MAVTVEFQQDWALWIERFTHFTEMRITPVVVPISILSPLPSLVFT